MAVSDFARVLIGFGIDALSSDADPKNPVGFTDVTQWCRRIETDRGRASVFVNYAGTGRVELNNNDARFDPTNPASPYAGNMTRSVPIVIQRLDANGSDWTTICAGYTRPESWRTTYRDGLAVTTLFLGDGSFLLGAGRIEAASQAERSGDTTGSRIGHVADDFGWPAGWRSIDDGAALLAGTQWGSSHWSHCIDAAEADGGHLFFDAGGYLTFKDRHAIRTETTARLTVHETTESLGSAQVRSLRNSLTVAGFDETFINYVSLSRPGGTAQVVDARGSSTEPQIRFARNQLVSADDREVASLAAFYGDLFTQSVGFPSSVKVRSAVPGSPAPSGSATTLTATTDVDLRQRVAVTFTPPGRTQQTWDVLIERVRLSCDMQRNGGAFDVTFGFSPWDIYDALNVTEWLVLDDPTNGILDTNRLGY